MKLKLILISFWACLVSGLAVAQEHPGQAAIFLEKLGSAGPEAVLHIDQISLQGAYLNADIVPVVRDVSTATLAQRQMLVALTDLQSGDYARLLIRASAARTDSTRRVNLQTIELPLRLEVAPNQTRALFIRWIPAVAPDTVDTTAIKLQLIGKALPPQNSLGYASNEGSGNIFILDRLKGEIVGALRTGDSPRGLALSRIYRLLLVANAGSNSISVFETGSMQLRQEVRLDYGDEPEALCLSPDERRLYVADHSSNSLTVLDLPSLGRLGKISVGMGPVDVALDPSGSWVYVVNNLSDNVSLISPATLTRSGSIDVGSAPTAIAFDPQGGSAYVASFNSGYLSQINPSGPSVTATFNLGRSVRGLAYDRFSETIFGTLEQSGSVAVFKPSLGMVLKEISVGVSPRKATLDPDNGFLYVTCEGSNDISVISAAAGRVVRVLPAGTKPYAVVFP